MVGVVLAVGGDEICIIEFCIWLVISDLKICVLHESDACNERYRCCI